MANQDASKDSSLIWVTMATLVFGVVAVYLISLALGG